MKQIAVTLCILLMIQSIYSIHRVAQLQKLSTNDIEQDNLIELIESSTTRTSTKLNKDYYSIKVMRKDKKDAYSRIKNIYQHVVKILIKNKIIPGEDNLVKSKIKPQFLSRKRTWVFSIIFVILGNPKQLETTQNQLTKLGVQKLSTRPAINFLNEKVGAIEIFNSAKQKLSKKLQDLGDYEIKSVVQIELKGREVENADILEQQLEEEFNQSEDIIQEQDIVQTQNTSAQGEIEMKIVFKIGKKQEQHSDGDQDYDHEDEQQEQQEDSEQSQSL